MAPFVGGRDYTVAIGTGEPRQEITDYGSVTIDSNLDSGCELSFDLRGNSTAAQYVDELAADAFLYVNGNLAHRYRIVNVGQTWDTEGNDLLSIQAVCYKRLLDSRIILGTAPEYVNTPQDEIIWGLIQNAQAQVGGDLGITYPQPGGPDAINRTRTEYALGDNIGAKLKDLTEVEDGMWFEVNGALQLVQARWDGLGSNLVPARLGSTVRAMSRESGASEFANAVFVDGDDASTVPEVREAAGLASDPRGRWDATESFSSVSRQSTLADHADGLLQQALTPPATWSMTMEPTRFLTDAGYNIGEEITIVVPPTTAAPVTPLLPTVQAQVMSVQLGIDAAGATSVVITAVEL